MTKEELAAGLRNAIEHGSSLDEAVQSFINAGYNPQDVKDAKEIVSLGASSIIQQPKQMMAHQDIPEPKPNSIPKPSATQIVSIPSQNQQPQQQQSKQASGLMILGISVLLFLIGVALLFMLFGESILAFFLK